MSHTVINKLFQADIRLVQIEEKERKRMFADNGINFDGDIEN